MFKIENIINRFLGILKKIKGFLLRPSSREFFVFLFFLTIASGFWLLQTLNEEYDEEFKIPLVLVNLPDDIILTNEQVDCINVKVKDKGTLLLNYTLSSGITPIEIDYNELIKRNKTHVQIPISTLQKKIKSRFNPSSEVLTVQPDSLELFFAKGEGKKVPVVLTGRIEVASQYVITDTIISPDSVTVYAPSTLLDEIVVANTESLHLEDITDSLTTTASFKYIKGLKYLPNSIQISLKTDILTEKTIKVPVKGINFPLDKELRTFPSFVEITFQVGTRSFNEFSASDFLIEIDYHDLINQKEDTYRINVSKYPIKIKKMRVWPRVVDFLIEKNDY